MVYLAYMPGHSHTGGSHTLWGPSVCERLVYMPGTRYNFRGEWDSGLVINS